MNYRIAEGGDGKFYAQAYGFGIGLSSQRWLFIGKAAGTGDDVNFLCLWTYREGLEECACDTIEQAEALVDRYKKASMIRGCDDLIPVKEIL